MIGVITAIGIMGGLRPLERMERWALYVTILVLAVLLAAFALRDISDFLDTGRFVLAFGARVRLFNRNPLSPSRSFG